MKILIPLVLAILTVVQSEPVPKGTGSPINKLSLPFMNALTNQTGKNQCYSPLSLATAVAMAKQGAAGETLTKVSQFFENKDPYETVSKIERGLKNSEDLKLNIGNLVLLREDFAFKDSFKMAMTEKFAAGLDTFNVSNLDEATNRVNDFVSKRTGNLIPKVIEKLDAEKVLVLVNTVALDAKWKKPFTDGLKLEFEGSNGKKTVPFMSKVESMKHHHCPIRKELVVEIEYKGGLSMLILLPDQRGSLSSVLTNLTEQDIEDHVNSLTEKVVRLLLPKFEVKSEYSNLISIFRKMGIAVFDESADLSNLATGSIAFDSGVHKAVVKVDKDGTKAVASTVLTGFTKSGLHFDPPPLLVEINHPFLFIIREPSTRSNLFVGTVHNI